MINAHPAEIEALLREYFRLCTESHAALRKALELYLGAAVTERNPFNLMARAKPMLEDYEHVAEEFCNLCNDDGSYPWE